MSEIKKIIDDMGIAAFESNIKIAAFGVISNTGDVIFQTENWNLKNDVQTILKVIKGQNDFVLNHVEYTVVKPTSGGIIGTNPRGMGHVLFTTFQRGILVSYAMPQSDSAKGLAFLVSNAVKLNGKI